MIIPIYKKGNKNLATNYHGVTLLDVISKLFTEILNNRLCSWAETNDIYAEGQCGFRDGFSTADGVFLLNSVVDHWLSSGRKFYCAMVDFRKAFDYIVYDNLWRRLIEKGITGKTLAIIRSMYRQLKNHIRGFNGDLSNPFHGAIAYVRENLYLHFSSV